MSSATGAALGALFSVVGRVRPAAKPLHPRGALCDATVSRAGVTPKTGVGWIDEPGHDQVLVRLSRATGLPQPLPDIHGLALRVTFGSREVADLLFATTGIGRLARFLLLPTTSGRHAQSTLLPYRTAVGPLLLAAFPSATDGDFDLACASPLGRWRRFATLHIDAPPGDSAADPLVAFDPVLNTLPGLQPYEWVRRLREKSYAAARRSR